MDFQPYLSRWRLIPDGEPISTHSSDLLPALRDGAPVMLKVAREEEERLAARVMEWWQGEGAAKVLELEDDALLLERATGPKSLIAMACGGGDGDATRILCSVASALHAPRGEHPATLFPLARWFDALWPAAERYGGRLKEGAAIARELLASPRDVAVLHGDIHHGNILDFGERGWLAIDPKGLFGERTFDFVNILRNPIGDLTVVLAPDRLGRQTRVIAEAARLEGPRLLQWTIAFTALSSAWVLADGKSPDLDIAVAEIASAELAK